MSQTRMSAKEERKTARGLRKSLEATHQGLATLLKSLEHSGFKEAVSPYQQMQLVLIQQRLWGRTYRRDELNPLWRKIAEKAEAIHAILAPFSAVMDALKDIDRIKAADDGPALKETAAPPDQDTTPKDATINEIVDVFLDGLSISNFSLSRRLSSSDETRWMRLQRLTAAGVLKRRGWGRGLSYRLTLASRQRLASALATLLQKNHTLTQFDQTSEV